MYQPILHIIYGSYNGRIIRNYVTTHQLITINIIRSLHEPYIIRRRGGDAPSQPITPFTCNVIKPLLPHYKGFVMTLPSSCNQPKGLSSQTQRAAITSQKAIAIPQPICHYNIKGWHIRHFKEPKWQPVNYWNLTYYKFSCHFCHFFERTTNFFPFLIYTPFDIASCLIYPSTTI